MRRTLFSALLCVAGVLGFGTAEGKQPCTAPSCGAPTCDATCAADPGCAAPSGCADGCCGMRGCGMMGRGGCGGCGGFGGCNACGCGHYPGKHFNRGYEGLDRHFNCGCNGSYKFPVPPLYTYHWPGLYSQQLMTDYHSPWRFPPIKPYSDEHLQPYPSGVGPEPNEPLPPAPPTMTRTQPQPRSEVQAADYATSTKVVPGTAEAISDKLKRASRYLP